MIQRFGEKLRLLRLRQGMTLRDLTRALGYVGSGYVSEVETGKRAPTAEFVLKVARLFNVSADRLLKDELEVDDTASASERQ
jgi:transcriptional regulator with XRE-family HTH domain